MRTLYLLFRSVGERNKFTIEKLNSSRSALAEKGASDSEAHEFIAPLCVWCLANYRYLDYPPLQLALKDKIMPRLLIKPIIAPSQYWVILHHNRGYLSFFQSFKNSRANFINPSSHKANQHCVSQGRSVGFCRCTHENKIFLSAEGAFN